MDEKYTKPTDPGSGEDEQQAVECVSHNLMDLSLLASKAEWRKLKIEDCVEEANKGK